MADVQEEVEALAAALGCAVLIEDARHRPLWWSAQGEVDEVRTRTILQREAPPAAAALVTRLDLAHARAPVRTPALPEVGMAERWCVPVRVDRQVVGYVWVLDAAGKVGADDLGPVVHCAESAAAELARLHPSAPGRDQQRQVLLRRLVAGPDAEAAAALIELEGLPADVTVAVNAPPAGGWALPGGASAHVAAAPGAEFTSGAPVPLVELAVAVGRASSTRRALRAGARLTRPSWDALGAWHLIVAAPTEVTPGRIHPGAEVLLAQKRPDLLVTTRCVLDNGGDVTVSAQELHVHRTTLYYRLERIEALTGVNLRAAAGRDDLHLALLLAAYRAAG